MEKALLLLSQVVTLGMTGCMFHSIFKENENYKNRSLWVRTGILLAGSLVYMLLPVHITAIREQRDWILIGIGMLLPVLVTALLQLTYAEKKGWRFGFGLVAVLVLGVIGRWDGVAGLKILFLICIAGICRKCWEYPVIGVLGTGLAYPTYLAWKHWIFDGSFAESGFEYTSIMNMGYSIGGLFSTYFHRGGNPGMGILLFGCQIFLWYVTFVKGQKIWKKADFIWLGTAGLLTVMSLRYFPWDYVQRIGQWSLGLVSLIRTPAVFFTYAQIILSILSVEKIGTLVMMEEESKEELKKAV